MEQQNGLESSLRWMLEICLKIQEGRHSDNPRQERNYLIKKAISAFMIAANIDKLESDALTLKAVAIIKNEHGINGLPSSVDKRNDYGHDLGNFVGHALGALAGQLIMAKSPPSSEEMGAALDAVSDANMDAGDKPKAQRVIAVLKTAYADWRKENLRDGLFKAKGDRQRTS